MILLDYRDLSVVCKKAGNKSTEFSEQQCRCKTHFFDRQVWQIQINFENEGFLIYSDRVLFHIHKIFHKEVVMWFKFNVTH